MVGKPIQRKENQLFDFTRFDLPFVRQSISCANHSTSKQKDNNYGFNFNFSFNVNDDPDQP
jgi:hypothetical protein